MTTMPGTIDDERIELALDPTRFVAVTVKVYAVPSESPVIVQLNSDVEVQVDPPGSDRTAYDVIGCPPLLEDCVHVTVAWEWAGDAWTFEGAVGTVAGTMAGEGDEAMLNPWEFVATTLKVYRVPLVRPVTVQASVSGVART